MAAYSGGLGGGDLSPPAAALEVYGFWFNGDPGKSNAKLWYSGGKEADDFIESKFSGLVDDALSGKLTGAAWEDTPAGVCAKTIALDQFTRQLNRGTPEAFAGDAQAQAMAVKLLEQRPELTEAFSAFELQFAVILPLMHSESLEHHAHCLATLQEKLEAYRAAGDKSAVQVMEATLPFLEEHTAVLRRFGRYPSRNKALGRTSTPEEENYLANEAKGWEKSQG